MEFGGDRDLSTLRLGIVTRNRPDALAEAIRSLASDPGLLETGEAVVVVDASDCCSDPPNGEVSPSTGTCQVEYAGPRQKRRYIQKLGEFGIPQETAEFALFGSPFCENGTGANRNALLLATAGERLFSMDDDALLVLRRPQEAETGICRSGQFDPREMTLHRDYEAALSCTAPASGPALAAHRDLLGKTLPSESPNDGVRFIGMTMPGLVGDAGVSCASRLMWFHPASLANLIESQDHYYSLRSTRWVTRLVLRPTLSSSPFCMTTFIGLANHLLLPPFIPNGRSSDVLFGAMMRHCHPRSLSAYLPEALVHRPFERRSPPEIRKPLPARIAHAMGSLIREIAQERVLESPREAMELIGAKLIHVGTQPKEGLLEFLRYSHHAQSTRMAAYLGNRLAEFRSTAPRWAEDAEPYGNELSAGAGKYEAAVPSDIASDRPWPVRLAAVHRYCGDFGRLLSSWPALAEASQAIRVSGERMGDMMSA